MIGMKWFVCGLYIGLPYMLNFGFYISDFLYVIYRICACHLFWTIFLKAINVFFHLPMSRDMYMDYKGSCFAYTPVMHIYYLIFFIYVMNLTYHIY